MTTAIDEPSVRSPRPRDTSQEQVPSWDRRTARPCPYRPGELRRLRAELDERWPKLDRDEYLRWHYRVRDGRSPYARIRVHATRCQLDAVVTLALHLGLRRREIFALDVVMGHKDNAHVVVWGKGGRSAGDYRIVPWTDRAHAAMSAWLDCRWAIGAQHKALWLNVHAAPTASEPMTPHSFNRLLGTYVGQGWSLKRLRDTCAAGWVRAGLSPEHLRQLLGLSRIEDTLPYFRLIGGSLEGRMAELDAHFDELVGAVTITDFVA